MNPGSLVRNRYGYLEFEPKPDAAALDALYRSSYHSDMHRRKPVAPKSGEERAWIRRTLEFRHSVIAAHLGGRDAASMLDVGAGGGWALAYYDALGWSCLGIDLSADSCVAHNPGVTRHLHLAPLVDGMSALDHEGRRFDLVILDNVLEHLASPGEALAHARRLLAPGGIALVEVPNDFSALQEALFAAGKVGSQYWVSWPEHLQYFNADGLAALAAQQGLRRVDLLSDFPIDWFLFCPPANYVADPALGKACHQARMQIEQLMFGTSHGGTAELYRALARLGLGRNIVTLFAAEAR
jgi:2-polyprenyl-3-methyl-5-hydroxy-6-metoxy-1,4-benzoquinol methylase